MKKWQKVTIWVASILIVLVVGGLFAANYAVDRVLTSMVGMSVDDLLEDNGNASTGEELNGDESDATDGHDALTPDNASEDQAEGNESTDQQAKTDEQGSSNAGGQDTDPSAPINTNKPTASDKPASSEKTESNKSSGGYSADISTDKAKEVEENITVAEKAKVVTTLMGSLSASEIASLQKLASGGMSTDEKKAAKDILLEKLSEDQYNELVAIAAKHGLSQGRTYSEVIEDEY